MDKYEIVGQLAREQVVEEMVRSIAGTPLSPDLEDLVQMVYLILLEYDEDKIRNLHEHGEMRFFIARVILNQYRSQSSPFYRLFRQQHRKNERIGKRDFADGTQ